jgi:hypothetical protein
MVMSPFTYTAQVSDTMPLDDELIAAIFGNGKAPAAPPMRKKSRYINFNIATKEPTGWPLTRPLTLEEWKHVVKAMMVRRVPKTQSFSRDKLLSVTMNDIRAASDAGRIYAANDSNWVNTGNVLAQLAKDGVLKTAFYQEASGPSTRPVLHAYRTDCTEEWEGLVPLTVKAALNFMPVTDVLDLLVDALNDAGT